MREASLKDQLIRDPPNRINSVEEACVEEASFGDVTIESPGGLVEAL